MIWFTSDTHFGHENIIKYCNRPFKNVDEMDDALINNWNSVVKKDDIIYHLGDFAFGRSVEHYFGMLNGELHILRYPFHHDKQWLSTYGTWGQIIPGPLFEGQIVTLEFDLESEFNGESEYPKTIVLCHYPLYSWDKKHYKSWHLYGHVHTDEFEIPNSILSLGVGVDIAPKKYFPVSLDTVIEILDFRESML